MDVTVRSQLLNEQSLGSADATSIDFKKDASPASSLSATHFRPFFSATCLTCRISLGTGSKYVSFGVSSRLLFSMCLLTCRYVCSLVCRTKRGPTRMSRRLRLSKRGSCYERAFMPFVVSKSNLSPATTFSSPSSLSSLSSKSASPFSTLTSEWTVACADQRKISHGRFGN